MKTGSEPQTSDAARNWAAEILDAPPDGVPADFTAAFLRRLVDEDFVPPPIHRLAWRSVVPDGAKPAACPPLDQFLEERLSIEIEQFAGRFFSVARTDRVPQWQTLFEQARTFPRCRARLTALQAGLKVDLADLASLDPDVAILVDLAAELFVLRPLPRATQRREALRSRLTGDEARWQAAARKLLNRLPQFAALAPELIELLVNRSKNSQLARSNRRRQLAQVPAKTATRRTTRSRSSPSVMVIGVIAVIVLSGLFRAISRDSYKPPLLPSYNTPPYVSPDSVPDYSPPSEVPNSKSADEISDLLRKLNENKRNSTPGGTPAENPDNVDPPANDDPVIHPDDKLVVPPRKLGPAEREQQDMPDSPSKPFTANSARLR